MAFHSNASANFTKISFVPVQDHQKHPTPDSGSNPNSQITNDNHWAPPKKKWKWMSIFTEEATFVSATCRLKGKEYKCDQRLNPADSQAAEKSKEDKPILNPKDQVHRTSHKALTAESQKTRYEHGQLSDGQFDLQRLRDHHPEQIVFTVCSTWNFSRHHQNYIKFKISPRLKAEQPSKNASQGLHQHELPS